MSSRVGSLLIAGVIALCLIAGSPPRSVGDGGEYLVQAMNFASGDGPSLGRREIPLLHRQLTDWEPGYRTWDIEKATSVAADRRRDFMHFWFYALLATPFLWATYAFGAAPTYAFAALHLVLLGLTLWVVLPRMGVPATVLLFFSPLIWWIDKPHTEVFTVTLLTLALALMRERPWWALVAAGMATTQNLPVGVVYGGIAAATTFASAEARRDRRVWAGLIAGGLLAALQPVYTYWRYGTPSLLLSATRAGFPSGAELSAVVIDPNIGLLGNYQALLVAAIMAIGLVAWRSPRTLLSSELVVATISAAVFVYSFGRTFNMRHGGTPSLTRYALWFIPLMVPLLVEAVRIAGPRWRRGLWAVSSMSALICLFAFHPRVPQNTRQPTWLAEWLWTEHPAWHHPLPEVFAEILRDREEIAVPTATDGCEKVLVAGDQASQLGAWPLPCYPSAEIAPECRGPGVLCYANRDGKQYTFELAPGRRGESGLVLATDRWTPAMEPHVRALFDEWGWPGLDLPRRDLDVLRQAVDVAHWTFGSDERLLVVLDRIEPGATLRFRFPRSYSGRLIDPRDGSTVRELHAPASGTDLWPLDLPQDHGVLILQMTAEGSP